MIVTDHTAVDYRMIKRTARLIVDTRNAIPKES
jgi:UDP-N-acetyl-D-mannosaminuronate dehydrogenase